MSNISIMMFGARRHYAVPRILNRAGLLNCFYTDILATQGWPRVLARMPTKLLTSGMRRLKERNPVDIPDSRIQSFPWFGAGHVIKRARAESLEQACREDVIGADALAEKVAKSPEFDSRGLVYTFDRAGLKLMKHVRSNGGFAIMEQTVAPIEVDQAIDAEERARFPAWADTASAPNLAFLADRERAEWDHANIIICGSDYVRNAIANCGGPTERCHVVPSGVTAPVRRTSLDGSLPGPKGGGKLKVLFVGAVGLRKGAPYVLEVARRLSDLVEVRMVGSVATTPYGVAQLEQYVHLVGRVPRSEVWSHYDWADVLFFPSLNEGSAMVTYEALAFGLPVVCTPNTGSIVQDGIDGVVVSPRGIDEMCDALERMATDFDYLDRLRSNVASSQEKYGIESYGERLIDCIRANSPAGVLK